MIIWSTTYVCTNKNICLGMVYFHVFLYNDFVVIYNVSFSSYASLLLDLLFGSLLINLTLLPFLLFHYSSSILCQVDLKVPVVVRLEGTNVDQGKRILKVRIGDSSHVLC
jgi:hypothetical protein